MNQRSRERVTGENDYHKIVKLQQHSVLEELGFFGSISSNCT